MPIVKIRDSLVEVGGKPYSATEVFIHGEVAGEIRVSKSSGISGEVLLSGKANVSMELPGVLVVEGTPGALPPGRLEVHEYRKGLIVRTDNTVRDVYELVVKAESARLALSIVFAPKRIVLHYEPGAIRLEERPFLVSIYIRSPVLERKATAN
ncbi:MAG: hypothetical protein QXH02_04010 [Desulfurococcaceae archaeon]